jgi:hypothetical protein
VEKKVRWDVRRAPNFLHPLGIFDSYVCLIQNKLFFGTLRRISNLTNLAVTSWAFSWFLSPGLYGSRPRSVRINIDLPGDKETLPAKFLLNSFLSKLAPLTHYITDSDAELNEKTNPLCNLSGGEF